eukprot:118118-Pyramimonas_sp.AAC.1
MAPRFDAFPLRLHVSVEGSQRGVAGRARGRRRRRAMPSGGARAWRSGAHAAAAAAEKPGAGQSPDAEVLVRIVPRHVP